ncbi:MAG: bifunctional D-glycero-beta-D-manno-heptose-7-phosphate kinase/D-glycero-beta-D-manno-heptose 1-phosphate adenylyltransferase HldE [Gammaproteobacteria bacterium]
MPPIPDFESTRVLVVGDVILDRYWYGATSRISPEAPVPVVHVEDVEERPGGAANVATNIAALGATPVLMGITGDDEAADILTRLLTRRGVESRLTRVQGFPTVTKLRVVSRHQQLIRLDFEQRTQGANCTELLSRYQQALGNVAAVVLSDYGKGALGRIQPFIEYARHAGLPVFVDPKGTDFDRYRDATVITPNVAEFEAVVGACQDLEQLTAKGERLRRTLDLEALLITRGEHGMSLLREGQPGFHVPAHARDVYDVTGAGDTVIGVLAAAVATGQPIEQAMVLANLAAAVVVAKFGTAAATVDEIRGLIQQDAAAGSGVVTESALRSLITAARSRRELIVMTNGCFDILHAGHVRYLAKAKTLGHRLVVAVNDDPSVRRLKGQGRPVNPLQRRMAVLAALEAVDWVVPFTEDTPERLIQLVAPDVLVKGGDYRPEDIIGGDFVRRQGGRVAILEFEQGCSTTATIEAIQRAAGERSG